MFLKEKKHKMKISSLQRKYNTLLRLLIFIFILSFSNNTFSQYYNTGVDNCSTSWREINTPKFQIIYPSFYERTAQSMASVIDTLSPIIGKSLNTPMPKFPILLHTNTSYANGLTIMAPKRIEMWMTNQPDNYAYPNMWHLTMHEIRHSIQTLAIKKGASKTLINIFGEHIYGLIMGIFIPNWFLEGDAVVAETALSPTLRGKTPEFNMFFKAQVLDKGIYCYDKALQGSMKDYVPNEYILGYNLVSFAREKYYKDIWGDMLENVGRNFWKIQTFGKSQKKKININIEDFYYQMMYSLKKNWEKEDSIYQISNKNRENKEISPEKHFFTNYLSPIPINDSSILSLKTSYYKTPRLVIIDKNEENKISFTGSIINNDIAYKDGLLIWSEKKYHPRWENENYADLIQYNISTKQHKRLSFKKRLYTPTFNPLNNNLIAAIEEDSLNNHNLVIIDRITKKIVEKFENEGIYNKLSYPAFSNDTTKIYVILSNENGKQIGKYDVVSKKYSPLTPFSYNNITRLKFHNNKLYFIGDYDNTYQIYSLDEKSKNNIITKHSLTQFGVENYSFKEDSIILSQYSGNGYFISISPLENIDLVDIKTPTPLFHFAEMITKQEDFILSSNKIKDTIWESKEYKKMNHLFNFHSWAPLYIDAQSQDVGLGLSFFSQNLLGSSILSGGYKHLLAEDKDGLYINYTYQGFYPIINVGLKYFYYNKHEINSDISVALPYKYTINNLNGYFNTTFLYSLIDLIPLEAENSEHTLFNTLGGSFSASLSHSMATNDLVPYWGVSLAVKYQQTIRKNNARIFAFGLNSYIPSPFLNHGFEINIAYQRNSPKPYYFNNAVTFTRGVYHVFPKNFYGAKINYHLPLAYPDYPIGWFLYIQRFSASVFTDIGLFDTTLKNSFGASIKMDCNIFRISTPINVGLQAGYLIQDKKPFINFLFHINI